jgi:3-hydroxybutyryl-CoA dehydratase
LNIDKTGTAHAEVIIKNGDGVTVLEAVLKGILPEEYEKLVMRDMLAEGDPTNRI